MMKARSYNRRILSKDTKVNILEIREPIGELKEEYDHYLGDYAELSHYLVNEFAEAKELGSIINLSCTFEQLEELEGYLNNLKSSSMNQDMVSDAEINEINELMSPLIRQTKLLVQKYDVVITNPPYMAPSSIQKKYVQNNYPDSKSDLFAIFIEKCNELTKKDAYQAMITMHSWMFLSSYEKLRKKLLKDNVIINMAHLGARAFEDIGGEIVQTTAFVLEKSFISIYKSKYKRLVNYNSQVSKENEYLIDRNIYVSLSRNFSKIPGSPIAYWASENIAKAFEVGKDITDYIDTFQGIITGNNDKFLRYWFEVLSDKIPFHAANMQKVDLSKQYWIPYNKGGEFRKWYGIQDYVVYWKNGPDDKTRGKKGFSDYYLRKYVAWSYTISNSIATRIYPEGFLWDVRGSGIMDKTNMLLYLEGLISSKVGITLFKVNNSTLSCQVENIIKLPIILDNDRKKLIDDLVEKNNNISKTEWDSFEVSWDFQHHPFLRKVPSISEAFDQWQAECDGRFTQLRANEEELNRNFIDIYGLQDELTPEIEENDITVRKADLVRDVKSFISYAVGCMFGRYSLDTEGLAYAGGEWDNNKYKTFIPDADDIIPICDEDYFADDIVSRFIEFVRCVYGDDTSEENLKFISDALGGNGNPRDVLRNYFLKDFFKDHCNIYQVTGSGKRPIYWQFESGKKNGFKALVYIHRYTPDLIARMRTGYIHPLQSQYRTQIEMLNNQIDEASSTSEKVRLQKQLKKITEQAEELGKYEEKIHHWADKMEPMDLDDGVKVNYAKFQELLAKIK